MKRLKILLVNLSIVLIFSLFVYFLVTNILSLKSYCLSLEEAQERLARKLSNPDSIGNSIEDLQWSISIKKHWLSIYSVWVCVDFVALAGCTLLFVYCNPRLFRLSTWTNLSEKWAKNKQERAAARTAKAEADKQKRIEQLQAELDELTEDKKE